MTQQEVARLEQMREEVKKQDDVYSQVALTQIDYLLECAKEDTQREQRTRKGW